MIAVAIGDELPRIGSRPAFGGRHSRDDRSGLASYELSTRQPGLGRDRPGRIAPAAAGGDETLHVLARVRARHRHVLVRPRRRGASAARSVAPTTSANSPRAGIAACRGPGRQVAERARARSPRGAWCSSRQTAAGRSAPHASARSRASPRPGPAPRTARFPARRPRSGPAVRDARDRDRGRNPSNAPARARPPRTPRPRPAPPTRPAIGTTTPPSAGPRGDQLAARVADRRRPGVGHRARSAPPRRCCEQLAAVPGRSGRGSWSSASSTAWRSSSRRVMPRVLGRDQRHGAEDLERPERDVGEVADRRRDDVRACRRPDPRRRRGGAASPACGAGPSPRVQVVDAGRPRPELGDRRDLPLELGAGDHPVDPVDHRRVEARARSSPRPSGACRSARTAAGRGRGS